MFKRYSLRKLGDAGQMQLRFEGFNIFNHPQFGVGPITFLTNPMR